MNKADFLNRLDSLLVSLPDSERRDIIYDYEEHINIALENGEFEEEIIDKLGSPESIAKQYRVSTLIKVAEESKTGGSVLRAVVASVGLSFFNLIFILGPFLGICGVLFGLFIAGVAVTFSGAAAVIATIIYPASVTGYATSSLWASIFGISIGVGLVAVGSLSVIGMLYVTKGFYALTIKYLKANIKLIKG